MKNHNSHSNNSITQLLNDLEQMQYYLLMVKAAALAFGGKFNDDCPYHPARSPFNKEDTAEYFVCQFLELDPDDKLEQAMQLISCLSDRVETISKRGDRFNKTGSANINISIRQPNSENWD